MTRKIRFAREKWRNDFPNDNLCQGSERKDQVFSHSVDWIQHTIKFVTSVEIWWNTRSLVWRTWINSRVSHVYLPKRFRRSRFNGGRGIVAGFIASYWSKCSNQIDSRVNVDWVVRSESNTEERSTRVNRSREYFERGLFVDSRLWTRDKIDPFDSRQKIVVIIGPDRLNAREEACSLLLYWIFDEDLSLYA